ITPMANRYSRRLFSCCCFTEDSEHLLIVMLESPAPRCAASGLSAVATPDRIEQLPHAPSQALVIVRIVYDVAFTERAEQLARAVVTRSNHGQSAGERFQHHQRTRIVEGRMHQEVGGEIRVAHLHAVAGK